MVTVATIRDANERQKEIEKELDLRNELCKRSLIEFCFEAWRILEPATPLKWNWHHELICEELEEIAEGRNKRLIINVMPRSLKSLIVSVFFPAWEWLRSPSMSYLCMSYSSDLAQEHSYKRRQVVGSAWYQQLSQKQCILSDDRNRVKEFSNNSQGLMYARGADGSVTGVGALRIIGDDLNNPEKVESDVIREGCKKKWKDYSTTRQNDPKTTAIIIVQQRTHQDDISGYELSSPDAPKWKLIKLPTRCEKTETIVFPRSGRTIERSPESAIFRDKDGNEIKEMLGPYLHPDRFGKEEDDSARQKLGAYMYSGRHDQEPAPLEGGIFSLAKWQKWQNLPGKYELAISVDPSFGSTSKTASYVVVQLWAIAYPNFYLIHQKRKRCGFSETKQMIRDMVEEYSYLGFISRKLIEKKASGADIIEDLKEVFSGIVAISPKDDKEIRARAIAPYFESGNIWLPDNSIADDVETEFITFPNGSTDDQVDSAGQLILYYAKKNRSAKRLPATSFSIGG